MILTEKTVTRQSLEALAVEDVIYLVPLNTYKEGYHYIAGFKSREQCKMYRALLNGLSYDKTSAQYQTVDYTLECFDGFDNYSITPINEYQIQKTDPVYLTHPHRTSEDLLSIANDLLAPKQVEQNNDGCDRASAKIQAEKKLKPQPELEPIDPLEFTSEDYDKQQQLQSEPLNFQVKGRVKGAIPQLFSNWYVICTTNYRSKYGDNYLILATCSHKSMIDSIHFRDIICDTDGNYLTLGDTEYNSTIETVELLSLITESERLFPN